jgi:TonB family protein
MLRIAAVMIIGLLLAASFGIAGDQRNMVKPSTPAVIDTSDDNLPVDSFRVLDTVPELIFRENPEYPEADRQAGRSGKVWIKLLVSKQGLVRKAFVLKREEGTDAMDSVTIAAALKWVFKPAVVNGKPVACWVTTPISFVIGPKHDSTATKPSDSK